MAKGFNPWVGYELPSNFVYTLSRLSWDVFGTLTFCGRVPRPQVAYGHAWRHFRQASKLTGRPYSELLIALRQEPGELGGRSHFHYLLGGTKTSNVHSLCFQLRHSWLGQTGATQRILRPYDNALSGVEYVMKALNAADMYETGKFLTANEVTLSSSVYRVVGSLDRIGRDTAGSTCEKTGIR